MRAVPTPHAGIGSTVMVRGLVAPLSPRELRELIHLFQGKDFEPDPAAFKRFVMLGLVDQKLDGFALTDLGRQRLDAERSLGGDHVTSPTR
jgi:hypothetical protein